MRSKLGFFSMAVAVAACFHASLPSLSANEHKAVLPDQTAKDPTFASFINQLKTAVAKKDKSFMLSAISPQIATGLGAGTGKQAFLGDWDQLSPSSEFWPTMARIGAHGAVPEDRGEMRMPATDFADTDGSAVQGVLWNRETRLHKSADASAPVVATEPAEQVTILEPADAEPLSAPWIKVRTRHGATGYVQRDEIYSAYDYYAVFEKAQGKWRIKWFGVAGL